jgi:hypothetical protein
LRAHRKHVIAVLKNESRDLLQDARALFDGRAATRLDDRDIRRLCWDLPGFTTWPQCGEKVRVVRSFEQTIVRRQTYPRRPPTSETYITFTSPHNRLLRPPATCPDAAPYSPLTDRPFPCNT